MVITEIHNISIRMDIPEDLTNEEIKTYIDDQVEIYNAILGVSELESDPQIESINATWNKL